MKNYFLTLFILLYTISISAQKIKIEKGEIKLDEKTVGGYSGQSEHLILDESEQYK